MKSHVYQVSRILVDTREFLPDLAKRKLKTYYHPKRAEEIPKDAENLVYRGIVRSRRWGEWVIEGLKRFHPQLAERILKA